MEEFLPHVKQAPDQPAGFRRGIYFRDEDPREKGR